jgi:hypothetical protein
MIARCGPTTRLPDARPVATGLWSARCPETGTAGAGGGSGKPTGGNTGRAPRADLIGAAFEAVAVRRCGQALRSGRHDASAAVTPVSASRCARGRDCPTATGEQPATPRAAPRPSRAWRTVGSASNTHSRPRRRRCPAACGFGSRAPAPRGRNGHGLDGERGGGGTKARARLPRHAHPERTTCCRSTEPPQEGPQRDSRGCSAPPPPDLTVLTAGARKCADTTTMDSSARSHEAARSRYTGKHGG